MDEAVAHLTATHDASGPGFCLAFICGGEVLRQTHHGMAHLEWHAPISGNTRFYLASESKPWVAILTMDAAASGLIRLDEDVRSRLPVLKSYESPICLGHLLRHTSGIADYLFLWQTQVGHHENDLVTQSHALDLIRLARDVSFAPGTRYEYSNSNFVLLAELLNDIEGCDLATLAHRRYFEPWNMRDTSFEIDPWRVMPRRARSYEHDVALSGTWRDVPVSLASWGDGGMWSTLDDLVRAEQRWQENFRADPSNNVLVRCMEEDRRFAPPHVSYRYGLEVAVQAGQQFLFHGGCFAGFSSLVLRCLESETSLVVLSNLDGFDMNAAAWIQRIWGSECARWAQ